MTRHAVAVLFMGAPVVKQSAHRLKTCGYGIMTEWLRLRGYGKGLGLLAGFMGH